MPGPKTKEEYRKDLLENISLIKAFDPTFEMTQEQIDYMLSDERMNLHQKYYGRKPAEAGASRNKAAMQYTPRYPSAFSRHVQWFAHDEKTEEDRKYNEKLMENIGRDDEVGLRVQNQYVFNAFNAVADVDVSKFDKGVSLTDFLNYAEQNTYFGKAIMETEHLLSEFKNLKPTEASAEKIRAAYNLGSAAGAVLGDAVELAGNEGFITLPVEFLNDRQKDLLMGAITRDPERLSKYGNYVAVMKSWIANKADLPDAYKNFRQYVKEGEKIGPDDFEARLAEEAIIGGGYEKRRETALRVIEENASYDIFSEDEHYKEMVSHGNALKQMINKLGDRVPNEKEQEELSKQAKKYTRSIYEFTKIDGVLNSEDSNIRQIGMNIKNSQSLLLGYSDPDILSANVHYFGVDTGYMKEVELLVKQLKKTEGNLTANSPEYDKFSELMKAMPNKLKQLNTEKNVTFEKIQEIFKPAVDAAGEYFESHKDEKLNSRQFRRLKIMNRLKDLSKEASQRSGAPGKNIDYRLAEKIYTAKAIQIKSKDLLMNDDIREKMIRDILNSDEFKRDFGGASAEAKEKMLKIPGDKVINSMMKHYGKSKEIISPENVNSKDKPAMKMN